MVTQISTGNKKQISISVKTELIELVEQIVKETNSNRSEVISLCLEELARNRKERLMIEYYQAMAQEENEYLKKSESVINAIVSGWSE